MDCTVEVGICEPPAAPMDRYRDRFDKCSTTIGEIEDRGRLRGAM